MQDYEMVKICTEVNNVKDTDLELFGDIEFYDEENVDRMRHVLMCLRDAETELMGVLATARGDLRYAKVGDGDDGAYKMATMDINRDETERLIRSCHSLVGEVLDRMTDMKRESQRQKLVSKVAKNNCE